MIDTQHSNLGDTIAPIRPVSLRDQVYEQIRLAILERRLKPGDHVREQELTKLLQVSRTPLREALGLAERDGFVQYFPNRGWFVTKFTPPEIHEIFVIRAGLENLAVDLCIDSLTAENFAELEAIMVKHAEALQADDALSRRRVDLSFHRCIVEFAHNQRLLQMWGNIMVQCSMVFHYRTVIRPDVDHWQALRDHRAIVDALRSGSAAAVHAINNEITQRVARECTEGFHLAEGRPG